jgi:hypothetical protein
MIRISCRRTGRRSYLLQVLRISKVISPDELAEEVEIKASEQLLIDLLSHVISQTIRFDFPLLKVLI